MPVVPFGQQWQKGDSYETRGFGVTIPGQHLPAFPVEPS